MGNPDRADPVWDVALVCLPRDGKESSEMGPADWALAGRGLPGPGRLGTCVEEPT